MVPLSCCGIRPGTFAPPQSAEYPQKQVSCLCMGWCRNRTTCIFSLQRSRHSSCSNLYKIFEEFSSNGLCERLERFGHNDLLRLFILSVPDASIPIITVAVFFLLICCSFSEVILVQYVQKFTAYNVVMLLLEIFHSENSYCFRRFFIKIVLFMYANLIGAAVKRQMSVQYLLKNKHGESAIVTVFYENGTDPSKVS